MHVDNMIRGVIFLLFLSIDLPLFSQDFINNTRKQVKRKLESHVSKTKMKVQWQETPMTLTLSIRDSGYKRVDFIFDFNNKDKCIVESRSGCDTCIRKYLKSILDNKHYEWVHLNDTNYISKYSKGLSMEILKLDTLEYLRIKKLDWNKAEYDQMMKSH